MRLCLFFTALGLFSCIAVVSAQSIFIPPNVVAPADYEAVSGNTFANTLVRGTNSPRTYQMQLTPSALGGLPVGARITELRFRASSNSEVSFPAATASWSDYEVRLAQAAYPISTMRTTFRENLLNPVLVKDGALSISANTFSAGGNPNPFGTLVVLDTPYVYQGGDLVMQFTHNGSDSTNHPFLDAISPAASGYGTSFRAISFNTFAALTGFAASVMIVEIGYLPTITQAITTAENQVIINGSGGYVDGPFRILATTNIELPVAQWTTIVTNQFGIGGFFSYTNVLQPDMPVQYFRVTML